MTVTAADFEYVRKVVADESALVLGDDKDYLVANRLAPVAERQGMATVGELIEAVRGGSDDLRRELVEALCTHETLFFRDGHPFEALREVVLPERARAARGRGLALWSAATSTGQEAYSLAMIVRDELAWAPGVSLLATDLSVPALARGRAGWFSALEVRRGLEGHALERHFEPSGRGWRVRAELRAMIAFRQLNLARPLPSWVPPMDVILLRNVLIYFDEPTRRALLAEIAGRLRPGGYLCLGGAETVSVPAGEFERVQIGRSIMYRRVPC